jgi:hypothetical protein
LVVDEQLSIPVDQDRCHTAFSVALSLGRFDELAAELGCGADGPTKYGPFAGTSMTGRRR